MSNYENRIKNLMLETAELILAAEAWNEPDQDCPSIDIGCEFLIFTGSNEPRKFVWDGEIFQEIN